MGKRSTGVIMVMLTALAGAARADDGGWRAAFKVSLGEVVIDKMSHGGTIGTGAPLDGFIDGQLEDTRIDDYTAGIGASLARPFGAWTLEGELIWRYRTDWDMVAPTPSLDTVTNVFGNVQTTSVLVNLTRTGRLTERWDWELGAGVGLVRNDIEADYVEREVPGVRPEYKVEDDASETEASFNILAGVRRQLNNGWQINVRLRYVDLGDLSAGPFPDRAVEVSAEHRSTELQFSFERGL